MCVRTPDCERDRLVAVQRVKTCRIGGELPRELFTADCFCSLNRSIMREYRFKFRWPRYTFWLMQSDF